LRLKLVSSCEIWRKDLTKESTYLEKTIGVSKSFSKYYLIGHKKRQWIAVESLGICYRKVIPVSSESALEL